VGAALMDPAIASIIATVIGAAASVAVGWIVRARISTGPEQPTSAGMLQAVGWCLVGLLYLVGGVILLLIGYFLFWGLPPALDRIIISGLVGVMFLFIGHWAQRRLRTP
jgi:hypothetical protein